MQNKTSSYGISSKPFIAACLILLSGCATMRSVRPEPPSAKSETVDIITPTAPVTERIDEESIDVLGLQRSLGLDRLPDDLGFIERPFNTCSVGYGFSASRNCRNKSFVTINFRLQCRDSEGTVSDASYEVEPVVSNRVKWNLGRTTGFTKTNTDGFGQVIAIHNSAQANERLRLTVDGHFLILTASDIRRLVVPKFWCANAHR